MSTNWIKALGGGARGAQLPDDWASNPETNRLRDRATFAKRPTLKPGDKIIYYASGTGIVFAVGEVTSFPYDTKDGSSWPWVVNVNLVHKKDTLHDGISLDDLSVDERDLRLSVRQQSHVKISDAEYEAAVSGLS